MRGWSLALALAVFALASPAQAQDAPQQARAYLENGMATHAERGYRVERTVLDLNVPLQLDGAYVWSVYLRAGENYRVYGACDNDCTDLDMEIYGADGMLADRDIATDDTPFVQITPTQTGRAFVRLWLYQCSAEPCYVAARVVSGGRPAPRETTPREEATEQTPDTSDYEAVVLGELDDAGVQHLAAGYRLFGAADTIEPIALEGDGHRISVRLDARRSYMFQGACDQDCSDVDMEILDPSGRQVDEDIASDDRPAVTVRPPAAGDYTVRIWLAQCSVEPCYVGVRGYSR